MLTSEEKKIVAAFHRLTKKCPKSFKFYTDGGRLTMCKDGVSVHDFCEIFDIDVEFSNVITDAHNFPDDTGITYPDGTW